MFGLNFSTTFNIMDNIDTLQVSIFTHKEIQ